MRIGRHRERGEPTPQPNVTHTTRCDGTNSQQVWTSYSAERGLQNGSFETCDDVVTDHFPTRKAKGEIINNPVNIQKWDYTTIPGNNWAYTYTKPCSGSTIKTSSGDIRKYEYFGEWLTGDSAIDVSALRTIAGTQAEGNVVSPEIMGGENMREYEQTIRGFTSPLENFHKYLYKTRHSRRFKASKGIALGQFIADEWLRYRYGYTPLINDIFNLTEILQHERGSLRHTARGSASWPVIEGNDSYACNPDWFATYEIQRSFRTEVYVRAGVLYEHLFSLSDRIGLSMHNVIPTLWEFLPYSFVADWFVNAGDWLAAVVPKAKVKRLAEWTTYHKTSDLERKLVVSPIPQTYYNKTGQTVTSQLNYTHYVRTPGISVGLAFRTNDFNFQKSKTWMHIADGMALAGQYLKCQKSTPSPLYPRTNRPSKYKAWKGVVY